jgi:hypothetical protein
LPRCARVAWFRSRYAAEPPSASRESAPGMHMHMQIEIAATGVAKARWEARRLVMIA